MLTNPAGLNGTFSDDGLPEGSTLGVTWSKVSGPGAVTFGNPGAEATTATFGEEGTYVLRLTVGDSEHTIFDELTVTVVPFNQPPTVNAGLDQTVVPPANSVRLNGSAADDQLPVGGQLSVTWSKVSGPGNVIFGEPHSAITAATFTQTGTYVLRLTANDSQYDASDDVTVTADCPGSLQHLDVVLVLDRSGSMSGQSLADARTAAKTFVDFMLLAEGDQVGLVSFESTARLDSPLTSNAAAVKAAIDALVSSGGTNIANGITAAHQELISARHNPASTPVMLVLSDGGATPPTAAANAAKAAGIRLITVGIGSANESVLRPIASSDSDYHQAPTSADLANVYASIAGAVCRTVNHPPSLSAGPDQEIELPTNTLTLNGSASDDGLPDGANFTTKWTKVSGSGTVTFGNANSLTTSVTITGAPANAVNTYVLRLTVSDSQFTLSDDVTVTLQPDNFPPTVSAGADKSITMPDDTVTLDGSVTDDGRPVGVPLTTTWSKVSGPGTVTFGSPGQAVTTATFSATGSYTLRLTANDGRVTKTDSVVVTVNPDNFAPTANAGANQTVTLPNTVNLAGSVTDDGKPAGSALVVTWSKVSGPGEVTFSPPNARFTVVGFGAAGTYVLRLTASDTRLTDTDDVTVTVKPANKAPVISAGPDQTVVYGANLLKNPGAEESLVNGKIPFWTEVSGTWTRAAAGGSPASLEGVASFDPEGETAELRQDVDVSAFAANIAAGLQQFALKAHCQSAEETPADLCRVILEYRNAANTAVLASLDSGTLTSVSEWGELTDSRPALEGTGWIRVRLIAARASGATNDAFLDGLSLSPVLSAGAKLSGTATDDGLPEGSTLSVNWARVSGPAAVTFGAPNQPVTAATFTVAGTYVLRLTANDSAYTRSDDVTVVVSPANKPPVVSAGTDQSINLPAPPRSRAAPPTTAGPRARR